MAAGFGPLPATASRVHEAPGRAAAALLAKLEDHPSPVTVGSLSAATGQARIPVREGGPESLNVAMAATIGLYELNRKMAPDA